MVQDELVVKAVSKILQRSERQESLEKLIGTYVDVGVLAQLNNENHQIVYGRRGTGKTHVFRVLGAKLSETERNTVLYIDARVLGSTAQFSDPNVGLPQRCLSLFRDILLALYEKLIDHIVNSPPVERADEALDAADLLAATVSDPQKAYRESSVTIESSSSRGRNVKADVQASAKPALGISGGAESESKNKITKSFNVELTEKVIFPDLHKELTRVLDLANTNLYILIDEWSSIPLEIQPYLAEFLKRGVLPVQRATVKIACLEYRSRFANTDFNLVGFELGADIATSIDLDDYYVYDRNPQRIVEAYADMLYRHLSSELPPAYLLEKYVIEVPDYLITLLFTDSHAFKELARAAEGVVRDLICIFSRAFFHAYKRGKHQIDRKAVIEAAREWFEQDKSRALDPQLQRVLQRVIEQVIGRKKARSFMLPRSLEKNVVVQRLFDSRLLHLMQRGYADKNNPGVRYNIYTLDYGTYVSLIGTSKQPAIDLEEKPADRPDVIVPFDDKRTIRSILVNVTDLL